jgi:hypothetical protein
MMIPPDSIDHFSGGVAGFVEALDADLFGLEHDGFLVVLLATGPGDVKLFLDAHAALDHQHFFEDRARPACRPRSGGGRLVEGDDAVDRDVPDLHLVARRRSSM